MNDPVVLMTTAKNFERVRAELQDVLEQNNILIRIISDEMFAQLFPDAPKTEYTEVPVDLSDDAFLCLAKEAHRRDITFNQLVEVILREEINKIEESHLQGVY